MNCVYCLSSNELLREQILVRGHDFYLCAPRGQLVEGYLAIAPYRCIGCLAVLPRPWFDELQRMKALVADFYRDAYGIPNSTFYEQGRAGGGAAEDAAGGFPLHAHLCSLPLQVGIEQLLASRFVETRVSGPGDICDAAGNKPYVYVETDRACFVYVPATRERESELERMRLKPEIATLLGIPERGHWRAYPGDRELEQLIRRFSAFMTMRGES